MLTPLTPLSYPIPQWAPPASSKATADPTRIATRFAILKFLTPLPLGSQASLKGAPSDLALLGDILCPPTGGHNLGSGLTEFAVGLYVRSMGYCLVVAQTGRFPRGRLTPYRNV